MNEQEKMEKVIKGLECCIGYGIEDTPGCEDCPYNDMGDTCERIRPLYEDTLALLKAQEPVEPKHEDDRPISPLRCGNCGAFILVTNNYKAKYCFECGREVRWT